MKVLTVIGNRPQFVKAAAVSRLLRERHDELLVHTGQHHDDELSTVFVEELGVPRPERELGIHGGTNTEQTARMLAALGPLLAGVAISVGRGPFQSSQGYAAMWAVCAAAILASIPLLRALRDQVD